MLLALGGAIRSGKTVSMALSYILWAMSTYSGGLLLAISGIVAFARKGKNCKG